MLESDTRHCIDEIDTDYLYISCTLDFSFQQSGISVSTPRATSLKMLQYPLLGSLNASIPLPASADHKYLMYANMKYWTYLLTRRTRNESAV